jgi:hypothetical protein
VSPSVPSTLLSRINNPSLVRQLRLPTPKPRHQKQSIAGISIKGEGGLGLGCRVPAFTFSFADKSPCHSAATGNLMRVLERGPGIYVTSSGMF